MRYSELQPGCQFSIPLPTPCVPGRLVQRSWTYDPTIDAPPRYKRACRYDAFIPVALEDLKISIDGTLAGAVSDAEHAVRTLNSMGGGTSSLAPLARLLLRTESIASSKIEGMQLGARALARAEAKAESGERASETAREILANIDAMVLAIEDAATVRTFSVKEIKAIHRRLMSSSVAPRLAGKLRAEQNWIGGNDYNPCGADFVPPPPEEIDRLLEDLCGAINDDRLPPLVQAALVHAQFETIHPFHDGNGRTGRALVHVVFRRRGLAPNYVPPISVVLARGKDRYIAGLTSFRADGVARWIEHFADATTHAARLAQAYVDAAASLTQKWRDRLTKSSGAPRAGAAAWAVIDVLAQHPIVTAPVATAATGRAKAAVYQALEQLEEAGVIKRLSGGRRNQAWEAVGLLELIETMDAGQQPR